MYYYSYERTREIILRSRTGDKGLSTLESMLSGLIAGARLNRLLRKKKKKKSHVLTHTGSAATIVSNPLWVMQTSEAVRTLGSTTHQPVIAKELGFFGTVQTILAKDGLG